MEKKHIMNKMLIMFAGLLFVNTFDTAITRDVLDVGQAVKIQNARATSVFVSGNDVYAVGYQNYYNNKVVAKLWKNGVAQDLSDGSKHTFAVSVCVSKGGDTYVAGYEYTNDPPVEVRAPDTLYAPRVVPKFWKNGKAQKLQLRSRKNIEGMATSVFVSGKDVYVVGCEVLNGNGVARLWKNGIIQNLSDGNTGSYATSVFVSGNDVYVAGHVSQKCSLTGEICLFARLWKNGISQNLNDGTNKAYANSVYVSGDDVYVAGCEYLEPEYGKKTPVLWKNGTAQYLDVNKDGLCDYLEKGEVNSVCVSENGDVYAAGIIVCRYYMSVMWKNGIVQQLAKDGQFLRTWDLGPSNSVFISGDDVYVACSEDARVAALWKNGDIQALTERPDKNENYIIR